MPKEFTLKFKEGESGLWFVTCEDSPSLFVAHRSLEAIIHDLPAIMRSWLKQPDAPLLAQTG